MLEAMRLELVMAGEVMYDHGSRLFPYSPRTTIDPILVERLKRSVAETGMWQPIVVRAGTMEGIAGNHRFLACCEHAADRGIDLDQLAIPAVVIECDEGMAVTIGLIENELREDLTQWEVVRGLLAAVKKRPATVETVFEVDGATIEQLRFWEEELIRSPSSSNHSELHQARLTREWLSLINARLGGYPDLQSHFMQQLRHPTWVLARTLDELDRSITQALRHHGIRFEEGETWNGVPPSRCLNDCMNFDELRKALADCATDLSVGMAGEIRQMCKHLRVFPRYIQQFVPHPDGSDLLELNGDSDQTLFPAEAVATDGHTVRGNVVHLVEAIDAYCVAPDVHERGSCFHCQERQAMEAAVDALAQQGIAAVPPAFILERRGMDEYLWPNPQREGEPCRPDTCPHADDDPPGIVAVVRPGGGWQAVCMHAECGQAAQAALIDWEKEERDRERQRRQAVVDRLCQVTVEQTLLAPEGLDLLTPLLLETIESVLAPHWDTSTMSYVVSGWQGARRAQIAAELVL